MATTATIEARRARIRSVISDIEDRISREQDFLEFGATHDYEYAMARARIESLATEKNKLQEIMGDLS